MLVWNAHNNKKVRCLAFAPDGSALASAAERIATVKLWNPTTGEASGELNGRAGYVSGVAFSADGALVATTTMNANVLIWDAGTRAVIGRPFAFNARYAPAFAPDGPALAAGGNSGVPVWNDPGTIHPPPPPDARGGEWRPNTTYRFDGGSLTDRFDSVAFSPNGKWLAAHGPFRAVIWDREKPDKPVRVIPHAIESDFLSCLAFSPDSERLALGFERNAEIHAVSGKAKPVKLTGHTRFVRAVGFTPDGRTAMTACGDGLARLWNAETGELLRTYDFGIGRLYSGAFSPDGLTCAAGGETGQIVVWDVEV
jgi:WD40 repeat protein